MKRRPTATIWLPDLNVSMLERAAAHPILRSGVARWWERSQRSHYRASSAQQVELVWPHSNLEWSDLAAMLRQQADVASQLRNGGVIRILTTASAIDMAAVLLALFEQFSAAEIQVVLVVDQVSHLSRWIQSGLPIITLLSPTLSKKLVRAALLDHRGVYIKDLDTVATYITRHADWTAIQCVSRAKHPHITLFDDRRYVWPDGAGIRVSDVIRHRAPSVWHLVANDPVQSPVFVHRAAPSLGVHVLDSGQRQLFTSFDLVIAEAMSAHPDRMTVVALPAQQASWQAYDDALVHAITHMQASGYDMLLVGVPHSNARSERYPVALLTTTERDVQTPTVCSLDDVRSTVWSFMT